MDETITIENINYVWTIYLKANVTYVAIRLQCGDDKGCKRRLELKKSPISLFCNGAAFGKIWRK